MGNLATDCIAYWDFEESRSGGILKDSSTNNHDLTQYNSPVLTQGRRGFGRKIQSANEMYLTTPDAADLSLSDHTGSNHEISIAIWVKWDRFPTLSDHSTKTPGIFAGSVTKMRLDTTASEEYRLSWQLGIQGHLACYMQVFDPAVNQNAITASAFSAHVAQGGPGRDGVPRLPNAPSIDVDTWYLLIGTWKRVSADYGNLRVHIYQGRKTDGSEPNVIWRSYDEGRILKAKSSRSFQHTTRPNWADTHDQAGTVGIGRWWSGSEYYEDFDVDSLGIWDYELTESDRDRLYNIGFGADFPYLMPGSDLYASMPGPTFLPVPSSLYQGTSWDVGVTPPGPPSPNGWWSVQPTLPVWHVPPRIQGWAYDNPIPRPAPVPLVSQWRLQASEPVDDRSIRAARAVGSFAPPITSLSSGTPAVIVPPDPPPTPPLSNSEAAVSDEPYRPGRADMDSAGYERS